MKKVTNAPFKGTKKQEQELKQVIKQNKDIEGPIMPILYETQNIYGYLPKEALEIIAKELEVSLEELYSVATFYSAFRLNKLGKYQISLCLGTVCYIKGANDILEEIKKELGIDNGECTPDGKFSLDTTRCLGCCAMAPVIMINDDVYGNVTKEKVKEILNNYK